MKITALEKSTTIKPVIGGLHMPVSVNLHSDGRIFIDGMSMHDPASPSATVAWACANFCEKVALLMRRQEMEKRQQQRGKVA
jgi:hypothetical protein